MVRPRGWDRSSAGVAQRGEPIVAPDLILVEVCNAARKSLRRHGLTPVQFGAVVNDVAQPFARLVPLEQLIRPAAALTRRLDHPVYDSLYLALADTEGLPVVTADQRLLAPSEEQPCPAARQDSDRHQWQPPSVREHGDAGSLSLALLRASDRHWM